MSNTNDTCAAKKEYISILLANNAVKEITVIMTYSKSTANESESCKRNDTDGFVLIHCIDQYEVETDAMTSKYYLDQSYM